MSVITDPYQYPAVWNVARVANVNSPGLLLPFKFPRKWKWDKKSGKGVQGETNTYNGQFLATGTLTWWLLSGPNPAGGLYTQIDDWYNFSSLFAYDPTKSQAANAVTIYHPSLSALRPAVTRIVCEELGNVMQVKDKPGLFEVACIFTEFNPQATASATSTPTGAKSNASGLPGGKGPPGAATDPADVALQKQIAAQLAIAQKPL